MAVGVGSSGAPEKIARNLGTSGLAPLLEPHFIVSAAHVSRVGGRGVWACKSRIWARGTVAQKSFLQVSCHVSVTRASVAF